MSAHIPSRLEPTGLMRQQLAQVPGVGTQDQRGDRRTQINRVPGSTSVCCSPTVELHSGVGQHCLPAACYVFNSLNE